MKQKKFKIAAQIDANEFGQRFNMSRRWTEPFVPVRNCALGSHVCTWTVKFRQFIYWMLFWWLWVELSWLVCGAHVLVWIRWWQMVRMTYSPCAVYASHQFNWSENCSILHTDDFSIYYYWRRSFSLSLSVRPRHDRSAQFMANSKYCEESGSSTRPWGDAMNFATSRSTLNKLYILHVCSTGLRQPAQCTQCDYLFYSRNYFIRH